MTPRTTINFCRSCGAVTKQRIPDDGDTKPRAVCSSCGTIHYVNPLNVVGTVPYMESAQGVKVLLCKRNIEPRKGFWTLPAGFMELNETLEQGAARETQEEAGAKIEMGKLLTLISVPQVGQVHVFYLAKLQSETFDIGPETQEARLFAQSDIPWDEVAFLTVKTTLKHFFADHTSGTFGMHCYDLFHPYKTT